MEYAKYQTHNVCVIERNIRFSFRTYAKVTIIGGEYNGETWFVPESSLEDCQFEAIPDDLPFLDIGQSVEYTNATLDEIEARHADWRDEKRQEAALRAGG